MFDDLSTARRGHPEDPGQALGLHRRRRVADPDAPTPPTIFPIVCVVSQGLPGGKDVLGPNSLDGRRKAALVRIMEQAVRDGIIDRNPARLTGWQREYQRAEDALDDPRALALPDWPALVELAAALVARSHDRYQGWGDVVTFAASTATWIWTVRRQTTTGPGGLVDKGTKGKRAREVPLIAELRPMLSARLDAIPDGPTVRRSAGRPDQHGCPARRDPLG